MERKVKESWRCQTGVREPALDPEQRRKRGKNTKQRACLPVDLCTHSVMDRGRTHHHVTKQKSEDQSRRPTITMDCYVVKMNSVVNAQTMSEEQVTCIAVKEEVQEQLTIESGKVHRHARIA